MICPPPTGCEKNAKTEYHDWLHSPGQRCRYCGLMREKWIAEGRGEAVGSWRIDLTCCWQSDGYVYARTWEKADRIRNAYTSGPGVAEHGYSAPSYEFGHRRSAVVVRV